MVILILLLTQNDIVTFPELLKASETFTIFSYFEALQSSFLPTNSSKF